MYALKNSQSLSQPVKDIAREPCISRTTLRRWVNEYEEYGESALPRLGNAFFNSTCEMKNLHQVEEFKMENEILKKPHFFLKRKNAWDSNFSKWAERNIYKEACRIPKIHARVTFNFCSPRKTNEQLKTRHWPKWLGPSFVNIAVDTKRGDFP